MRHFLPKILIAALFALGLCCIKNRAFLKKVYEGYHYDTFNVFHWKNIRFTSAMPNKNFVKTQYVIHNPKKFNAFIFGSSRVGYLPLDALPEAANGKSLRWYNMTHSTGIPNDHFMTINTFLKNGVSVDMVIVGFDQISMYRAAEMQRKDLIKMPYQVYEENLSEFLRAYLSMKTNGSIRKQVDEYDETAHEDAKKLFYEWGGMSGYPTDFSLTENPQLERYETGHFGYSQKRAHEDIEKIAALCSEHGIRLVLFTSPLYQILYRNSVEDGYFDFLRSVAQKCEFYNFSALNNYTMNPQYYYEWSHYRPALGLLVEKVLFGTDEERESIRRDAGDTLWGAKVNEGNVEEIIAHLQEQIDEKE